MSEENVIELIPKDGVFKEQNKEPHIETIIMAPHPDDEIIGCYSILKRNPVIIYSGTLDAARREEALKLKDHIKIKAQLFLMSVPPNLINPNSVFYFPDPVYENHPIHRQYGMMGEQMARQGMNVVFYTVNMNAPYIHDVEEPDKKEGLLNKVYPSQKSLWMTEKKYVLFEGYCKWIF